MSDDVRAAATVLVLRDDAAGPEVFMVRRHDRAAFMARAYVFPGGAVDPADREISDPDQVDGLEHARRQLPGLEPADAVAHHIAAVRELFEEAGVLLARTRAGSFVSFEDPRVRDRFAGHRHDMQTGATTLGRVLAEEHLRAAADALVLVAHWVTPPIAEPRRFDARFFAARLPPNQEPVHDDRETTDGQWITPSGAIGAAERREIIVPPPTWITLRELAGFGTVAEILAWAAGRDVRRREPARAEHAGVRVLLMPHPEHADRWGGAETPFAWYDDRWLPLKS